MTTARLLDFRLRLLLSGSGLILFFVLMMGGAYANDGRIKIIPEPVKVTEQSGEFTLDNTTVLSLSDNKLKETADWFTTKLKASTGYELKRSNSGRKRISLELNAKADAAIGDEGYTLKVTPAEVILKANTTAGIFYGLQTILQLLPPDIESHSVKHVAWTMPCADIMDYPRFGWRGLMLDVSRHFFTKDEVKQFMDEMIRYKYNTLHLHLADDEGWRIEIKSLPELTRVGAWRVPRTGRWGKLPADLANEQPTDGGFYTQEDIKELLKYAAARGITILPEIDVPAHSLAMIASYPNLSCTQLQYRVNAGRDFYTREDNVLCVGNDSIFVVLDKVFTELAALFPSKYIHVGGDEAYKGFWKTCPKCKARMEHEHLKDVDELQSYFVKRMETMLKAKGKKMIGWDEILEGGLAPEATVMSWRGMAGGITAAKMNHHVVMTPWDFVYLDLYQGEQTAEPPTYGMCRLSDSYNYDPVPDSVDEKYILGGQGNLWTESVPVFRHVEYMTWPRSIALSEVYWSPKVKRNWDDFIPRLEDNFKRLDAADIKYARSVYNVIFKPVRINRYDYEINLATEIKGLDLYYSFDNTNPDAHYPKYTGQPLRWPIGANILKVITYRDGTPVGAQVDITKEDLAKRLDEKRHVY